MGRLLAMSGKATQYKDFRYKGWMTDKPHGFDFENYFSHIDQMRMGVYSNMGSAIRSVRFGVPHTVKLVFYRAINGVCDMR